MGLDMKLFAAVALTIVLSAGRSMPAEDAGPRQISGIYPHLAVFSHSGEVGIGAVVPWMDRLWMITYPPHATRGSSDKLYEIDRQLNVRIRPESVGGTHACRMIHRESNQLIIGPYVIDAAGKVRSVDLQKLVGRMTAVAATSLTRRTRSTSSTWKGRSTR